MEKILYQKMTSLFWCLFYKKSFFLLFSPNGKEKNCQEMFCILRYFRLQRRMLCHPLLNSVSRECLPQWIMKQPACYNILIHVKWIYQWQSYQIIYVKLSKIKVCHPRPISQSFTLERFERSPNQDSALFCPVYPSFDRKYNWTNYFT